MMKSAMPRTWIVALVPLIIALTGCATTGKVVNSTFVDSRYNVDIRFPDTYSIRPVSDHHSRYRVKAIARNMSSNRRSQTIVPSYGVYVAPKSALQRHANTNEELFSDFVALESLNYCVRLYRVVARPYGEQTLALPNGGSALIRYFNSSVLLPGAATAYGNGMAAFMDQGDYFLKLEYVADSALFDKKEFISILQSINRK
jgi:hypothetical protein